MAPASRRPGWRLLELRVGDQFAIAHGIVGDSEFKHPIEDHPPASRSPSVEAEHKFVEVELQMCVIDTALMRAEVPPLGQGGNAVDSGQ